MPRSIRVNGQKIIDARRNCGLKQQVLSDYAKISLRSLQRAEKCERITRRILDSIAAELKINPESLIETDILNSEESGYGFLILKPILNYKDAAKFSTHENYYTLDAEYLINPRDKLIKPIADIISAFEYFCIPSSERECGQNHSKQFKMRMSLNKKIEMFIDSGISIFANSYSRKYLFWDGPIIIEDINIEDLGFKKASVDCWTKGSRDFLVLRFYENSHKGNDPVHVKVKYGLSDEVIDIWNGDKRRDITKLPSSNIIELEDEIDPSIEPMPHDKVDLESEIPF